MSVTIKPGARLQMPPFGIDRGLNTINPYDWTGRPVVTRSSKLGSLEYPTTFGIIDDIGKLLKSPRAIFLSGIPINAGTSGVFWSATADLVTNSLSVSKFNYVANPFVIVPTDVAPLPPVPSGYNDYAPMTGILTKQTNPIGGWLKSTTNETYTSTYSGMTGEFKYLVVKIDNNYDFKKFAGIKQISILIDCAQDIIVGALGESIARYSATFWNDHVVQFDTYSNSIDADINSLIEYNKIVGSHKVLIYYVPPDDYNYLITIYPPQTNSQIKSLATGWFNQYIQKLSTGQGLDVSGRVVDTGSETPASLAAEITKKILDFFS